ncbi:hypothetical protein HYH03_002635 [Edaphochlamys debaryana]|uniref:Ubiquinone biosynthesis monooxygenase COQ6, mitochondrial n=1 Tax=Edaphochlamys debaryana TaxID=47281 RepID=A0A835YJF8_9CHLO|nr:hypothetical protein HYH03_002635 [Edaphochlamys debaryana]|eukprot:KAG2499700.1 hypothetical protein HYH03_002635 [Edaphochlamys debaryana]
MNGAVRRLARSALSSLAFPSAQACPGSAPGVITSLRALSAARSVSPDECYDVVIVGGGMVGAAVAALLGGNRMTQQMRVAVLDVKPQPLSFTPAPVPGLRVSTITPGSIGVLKAAGAWEEVEALSAPFVDMQVWDAAAPGHIRWSARDLGEERMGVVAENPLLQASLLRAAQRSGGRTEFLWPAELRGLRLPDEQGRPHPGCSHGLAELDLADGRTLVARLVVAADGSASRVRQMAGLRTWGWGYGQRGVVATVSTAEPHVTAFQRFLPTGPLALLPVRGGLSSIVWSTTPEAAAALEALGPREFAAAVNKALLDPPASAASGFAPVSSLAEALGRMVGAGAGGGGGGWREPPRAVELVGSSPKSFPLQLKQAGRFVLPRLALVGDAAHAVHPLAGQGVNLGLGDAGALAEALRGAVAGGSDPGDARLLGEAYEAPRRRAVLAMTAAMDGVKRAFAVQAPPFAAVRGLGLGLINAVGPVRNGIMNYAMMGNT